MLPYVPNAVQTGLWSTGSDWTKRSTDSDWTRRSTDSDWTKRSTDSDWTRRVISWRMYHRGQMEAGQDFTQSVLVEGTRPSHSQHLPSRLVESVCVTPSQRFEVYRQHAASEYKQNQEKRDFNRQEVLAHTIQLASSNYRHNIRNPEMHKKQHERARQIEARREMVQSEVFQRLHSLEYSDSFAVRSNCEGSASCNCKQYHSHKFRNSPVNRVVISKALKRQKLLSSYDESSLLADTYDDPRNIFWCPELSFHSFKMGDPLVVFSSLWPRETELKNHLRSCGLQLMLIHGAVLDLCRLAVTCGPVRLLKCLIDLTLVRVDQQFANGSGMLHLACLSRNAEAVQFLVNTNISPNIKDRNGCTADQVCFCAQLRKQLPPRYLTHRDSHARPPAGGLRPSLQDKDTIFSLARNPKFYTEIQKKLQTFDFNVNTECDSSGDFLLHVAVKGGLNHLPSIMALMKIHKADIELSNEDGMTALMLAAVAGNYVLCDVLICLFGADANKQNPKNGCCGLHYAVEGNHRKTVECLLRRGADVNVEDHDGCRPDDVPSCSASDDDCQEVISFHRTTRLEALSEHVRHGDITRSMLYKTDLCLVDEDGYSLLMIAAIYNRADALYILLDTNQSTINAQHTKTGMTTLAIASQMGNVAVVEILLERGANPSIADMDGYLPLHHAVLNNQEMVLDALLTYFPHTYIGLCKAQTLCKKSSIHNKLKLAWERRQEEIVSPKVLDCTLSGRASELYCLLDDGDSINLRSGSGNWPLYLAVENGNLDVVKLLFEKGGDIRKRHSTTGATVLHLASKMGHVAIVQFLVQFCRPSGEITKMRQKGQSCRRILDINVVDAENKTALQLAAEKGFIKIANLLLECGATTAILDRTGSLFTCPEYEGVRVTIDATRDEHTKLVVRCVTDKSRKALATLQQVWLPRFDHNLRAKGGDTPLMLACRCGRLPVIAFLLESAVYPEVEEDDCGDESDADSGVLDPSGLLITNKPRGHTDELQASCNLSQSVEVDDLTPSLEVSLREPGSPSVDSRLDSRLDERLDSLLTDVSRPKGLSVFQRGYVSHISAVSLGDGSTPLHRAVQGGDNPLVVKALLKLDRFCVNLQNAAGLSALHVACKLGAKRIIDVLLSEPDIDLNVRTLDGRLPQEMTTNKRIIKKVQTARLAHSTDALPTSHTSLVSSSNSVSASVAGTTVNFDEIHERYEALKQKAKTTTTN